MQTSFFKLTMKNQAPKAMEILSLNDGINLAQTIC
jgi:hypothetical protein